MYQGFLTAQDEFVIVSIATSFLFVYDFHGTPAPSWVTNLAIHLHSSRHSCIFNVAGNDSGQESEEVPTPQTP
jgi:hypothetical protein